MKARQDSNHAVTQKLFVTVNALLKADSRRQQSRA